MRLLRALLTFATVLLVAIVVAATFALHLGATGRSVTLLRALVTQLGGVIAGQHTERIAIEVRVDGERRKIAATAKLDVVADSPGRAHLYFLLNEGLHVERVRDEQARPASLPFYRLGLLTVVSLPAPLAAGEKRSIGIEYRGDPTAGHRPGSGVLDADEVLLHTADFWFPADLQSFFTAEVSVTAPKSWTVVRNGEVGEPELRGEVQRRRWRTPRPVPGMALIAGHYRRTQRSAGDRTYGVYLPEESTLDAEPLLDAAERADRVLSEHYGPSGYPELSLLVHPHAERSFNDGSGVIVVAAQALREGDHGFGAVAHEVAHGWWGATVAEKWLTPGSGGQWIVEGFAEHSRWVVLESEYGAAAAARERERSLFDPARSRVLAELSAVDNELDPAARPAIYDEGAFTVLLLRQRLGDETFFRAARELLQRHRLEQVSDRQVEEVFATFDRDVTGFFSSWLRSPVSFDLRLDPQDGNAALREIGSAVVPRQIGLLRLAPDGGRTRETLSVGALTPLGDGNRLVLDPLVMTPDVYRHNNVLPRRPNPRAAARSRSGEFLLVSGEPYAWAPATVEHLSAAGQTLHSWAFDDGIEGEVRWSADGTRILVAARDAEGRATMLTLNASDGSRQGHGRGSSFTAVRDGVVVARGDRLERLAGRKARLLAHHPDARVIAPLASPDGEKIAYAVQLGHAMDLRTIAADGSAGTWLFTWNTGDLHWRWAPDASRLYAVLPGEWDWQLWEIPLDGTPPRVLVREAAAIFDFAVSPAGDRIAFAAAPSVDIAGDRREIFVIELAGRGVQRIAPARKIHGLDWLDSESLLVVASDPAAIEIPPLRELQRLALADESLATFPAP